jgi:hypothetical protein
MENKLTDLYELQVTPKLKQDLAAAANWGFITAIVGMISAGLSFLLSVSRGMVAGSILNVAIAVLIYIFLLQFGRKTKQALQTNDQGLFLEALKSLQTYFKILGILLIVALSIFVIMVLFGLSFGLSRL